MGKTIIASDLHYDEDEREYIGTSKFYFRKLKDACVECGLSRSKCQCVEGFHEPVEIKRIIESDYKNTIVVCIRECDGFEVGIEYLSTNYDDKTYKVMDMNGKFVWMDRIYFEEKNEDKM